MNILLRIAKEAIRYKWWLILAMFGTLSLTAVNLIAPRIMADMTGIVSRGVTADGFITIKWMAMWLLALYFGKIIFRFLSSYFSHRVGWKLVLELRMKVYNALQSFSIDYFHNKQTGDLLSRIMTDVALFEQIYAHIIPDVIVNFITLTGVTIILFSINARLALITCIPIPFILFAGWVFSTKVRPNFRKTQKAAGELSAQLQDNLSGIYEIQAFGRQDSASEKVFEKGKDFTRYMLRALKKSAVFHPSVEFLTSMGTVIVVGFGGYLAFRAQLSVEDIVAFLLYLTLFYAPIAGMANLMEAIQHALAGAERVIEVLDAPQSVINNPNAQNLPTPTASEGGVEGNITFDQVYFSYIKDVPVINNLSFEVKAGQMVAFVGATGVGKTTISNLVARFYDPTSGRVCIDGYDLKDCTLESLRKNISIVRQETFLFNGTIEENIAFAKPDATTDEIRQAATIARIHNDIMQMPDGYNTQIGERGVKLSGGQKQRLAIARAVLCQAPVLILDEATASVDVHTEAQIQQAINEIAGTRTILIIAHRLSTIRNADVIFVLENGQLIQSGNHNELIKQDGLYRRLCERNQ